MLYALVTLDSAVAVLGNVMVIALYVDGPYMPFICSGALVIGAGAVSVAAARLMDFIHKKTKRL